ncbi:MAG TPA: hypothetical protein VFT98_01445, partial [Myxococcota bacterium]|nr:hypothetical protein [Myxococcota bacterium]
MQLRTLLAAALAFVALRAEAITYIAATPIAADDDVPVTVSLDDVAGGCQVSLSIAPGSGTIFGFFGNTTDEAALSTLGVSDPSGVLAQWQFGPANQVWKVGAGNNLTPVDSWDYGVMTVATPTGPPLESISFTLTGITTAQIVNASTAGWILGVRIKGTNGAIGHSRMGVPVEGELPTVSIATPPEGGLLSASPVSVTGSVSPGATVTVNGNAATVSGTTFNASLPLADGAHTLTALATNATGSASDAVNITVDTTPPVVTITSPPDGVTTTAALIGVTGTVADASAIVSLTVNGQSVALVNGEFSTTVALALGGNTITATAVDAAGHSGSDSVTATRGDPPAISITSPTSGLLTNQTPLTVSGTITGTAPIAVAVNGVSATVTGTT